MLNSSRASRRARFVEWVIPAILVCFWQVGVSRGYLSSDLLPSPMDVARAGWNLTVTGELPRDLGVSLLRSLAGLAVGGLLGFILGMLVGVSNLAETLLDGSVQMLRTIPHLALVPLLILWLGIGEETKVTLVALGVLFPIYVNTFHGVRMVDRGLVEMGKVHGLAPWSLFREVLLPGALPSIMVGVRYALGIMWMTLIVAESISARSGIGHLATDAREFLRTDVVLLTIMLYALLGKLADLVARALERRLLSWHPNYFRSRLPGREARESAAIPMPVFLPTPEEAARRGEGVTLRKVTKRYPGREVLRQLDLEVGSGEFVAILGRSGCGKSTLLRLLCGIERPTTGSITWDGATEAPNHARMMFQDARLLPWKTVLENVLIGSKGRDPFAARRALQLVGLADRGRDWPITLSGGQKQRVALARALASEPRVLLLDEPFASLDALTRLEMQQWVEMAWMREQFTVLLVTHDVPEAVRLADRVITLEDGGIGAVDRVTLSRPRPPAHPVMANTERRLLDRLLRKTSPAIEGSPPPNDREENEANASEMKEETCPRLDAS